MAKVSKLQLPSFRIDISLSLGVSICLDVVLIKSLGLDIVKLFVSTVEKILTFSKSSSRQARNLDRDQHFSILSRHQCPDLKVSIEKFIETWKFCHFLTVRLDLDREVSGFLHSSCRDFSIWQDFLSFSYSKCLHNVKISRQILISLDNLVDLDKNFNHTKSRLKSLDFKNLDRDKKKSLSRLSRKSRQVLKVHLDCWDHQAYISLKQLNW